MSRSWLAVLIVLAPLFAGCEIDPVNPWDPETDPAAQAPAHVVGRVYLAGRDLEATPVSLFVRSAGGDWMEESGTRRVFPTRVEADGFPNGLGDDGLGAAGTFDIELQPGSYTIVFEADTNGVLTHESLSVSVRLDPGVVAPIELRPVALPTERFQAVVEGSVEGGASGQTYLVRLVPLDLSSGVEERVLARSDATSFRFNNVVPGVDYRVRVEGEGYAPAASEKLEVRDEHTQSSPLLVPPLRLATLGELFDVDYFALGSERPYTPDATVPVKVTGGAYLVTPDSGSIFFQARALEASVFSAVLLTEPNEDPVASGWVDIGAGGEISVDLEQGGPLDDGPQRIRAQLRVCLQSPCDCALGTQLDECHPPVLSQAAELSVTLDRAPPTLGELRVDGVVHVDGTVPRVANCVTFDDTGCPLATDVAPWSPLLELRLDDAVGRVAGWAATLDTTEPTTFAAVTAQPGLANITGLSPGIDGEDGDATLHLWARDAAGNVGELHAQAIHVDVTPIDVTDPLAIPSGVEDYTAAATDIEIATGDLVTLDLPTTTEAPARWRVRRTDGPLLLTGGGDAYAPPSGPLTAFLPGVHGDAVTLVADLEDDAGNVATSVAREVRLWRTGNVLGATLVEGAGAPSSLSAVLMGGEGTVVDGDTFPDGTFQFIDVMRGVYTLQLSAPGAVPFRREGVVVEPARDTALSPVTLSLPRGDLVGKCELEGAEGTSNNAGVQVSLENAAGAGIGGSTTLADGTFRFAGIPTGTGYAIVCSADGFVPAIHPGVEVFADVETPVNADAGMLPQPLILRELQGDFRLCTPTGQLQDSCVPLLATNLTTVELGGVDLDGIADYRVSTLPFPDATTGWTAVVDLGGGNYVAPQVTLGGAGEGRYTVYLQLRTDAANPGAVLTAEIIYDVTPPTGVAIALTRGSEALLDGFTNALTVTAHVSSAAEAGDVAAKGDAFAIFDTTPPTAAPAGTRCAQSAACGLPLDDAVERVHTAYAFACDRAGNCSATPVSAPIVYDVTEPRQLNGVAFRPVSPALVQTGPTLYSRSSQYDIDVDVGAAKTAAGAPVLDGGGVAVPDVVSYRFGAVKAPASGNGSFAFDGIPLRTFSSLLVAGATLSGGQGPPLPGIDDRYRVYAQYVDAAGNRTALEDNPLYVDLNLDTTPPGVSFELNGGDDFTRDPDVVMDTTAGSQAPSLARVALDDGLFDTFDDRAYPFAPGDEIVDLLALDPQDGPHKVHVRFLDPAGNIAERSDSIVLDREAPEPLVVDCGTCSFHLGSAYTNDSNRQVVLDVIAIDNSGFVESVDVNGVTSQYQGALSVTLARTTDGAEALDVRFLDPAGNASATLTRTVTLDRADPVPTLNINGGATVTGSASVTLDLAATDATSPVVSLRVSNTGVYSGQPIGFQPQIAWVLPAPTVDGSKRVYVEVCDAAGNCAEDTADITLDTSSPAGTVLLASGATYVDDRANVPVTLSFGADAVTHVLSTSELATDCSNAAFPGTDTPPPASTTVTFAATAGATPETRGVWVCTRDSAGNRFMAFDTILLDEADPAAPSPTTPGEAQWLTTSSPVFRWSSSSDADFYTVTIRSGGVPISGSPASAPTTDFIHLNPLSDGTYTWEVTATDAAGNEAPAHASFPVTFYVDTSAPTGLGGLSGGGSTNDPTPTLSWDTASDTQTSDAALVYTLEIADGTSFSAILLSADLTDATGVASTLAYPVQAPLGEGTYAWRVRVRDLAGNTQQVTAGTNIQIDTTAPASPAFEAVSSPTTTPLTLRWSAVAGASDYHVLVSQNAGQSGCGSFTEVDATTSNNFYALSFPSTDGCNYTAQVSSRDALGNESLPAAAGFRVDTNPPTVGSAPLPITINSGAATTASEVATLTLIAQGATQVKVAALENNNCVTKPSVGSFNFTGVTAQSYSVTTTYLLPPNNPSVTSNSQAAPTDQCKWLAVSFGDDAGNFTTPTSLSVAGIRLDTIAPDAPQISNSDQVVDAATIQIDLSADALDHNFYRYELRNTALDVAWVDATSALVDASCVSGPGLCSFTVSLKANADNRIGVRAVDLAGTPSAEDFVTIREDSSKPSSVANFVVRPGDQRAKLTWTANTETDLAGYRVYYKTATGGCSTVTTTYTGTFADQGASPVEVGLNTSMNLTGLPNGVELCVGIVAYDETEVPAPKESNMATSSATPWEVAPVLVTTLDEGRLGTTTNATVGAVAVRDGLLYAATTDGLVELDVSLEDCWALTDDTEFGTCTGRVKSADTMTAPEEIVLQGGYAFVADSTAGVHIYELVEGSAPTRIVTGLGVGAKWLDVLGDTMAVSEASRVAIYDISPIFAASPSVPTEEDAITSISPQTLSLQGSHLFIGQVSGFYDVSDPTNVVSAGTCSYSGGGTSVFASGGAVYALGGGSFPKLSVCQDLDSTPRSGGVANTGGRHALRVVGPYAYAFNGDELDVVDVSDRDNPRKVGAYDGGGSSLGFGGSVAVEGRHVYFVGHNEPEVWVLEVGEPSAIELLSSDGTISGGRAAEADGDGIVHIGGSTHYAIHSGRQSLTLDGSTSGGTPFRGHDTDNRVTAGFQSTGDEYRLMRRTIDGGVTTFVEVDPPPASIHVSGGELRWPYVVTLSFVDATGTDDDYYFRTVAAGDATGATIQQQQFTTILGKGGVDAPYHLDTKTMAVYGGYAYAVARTQNGSTQSGVEGVYRASVDLATGAVGTPTKVWGTLGPRGIQIYGRRAYVWLNSGVWVQDLSDPTVSPWAPDRVTVQSPGVQSPGFDGSYIYVPNGSLGVSVTRSQFDANAAFVSYTTVTTLDYGGQTAQVFPTADRVYVINANGPTDIMKLR